MKRFYFYIYSLLKLKIHGRFQILSNQDPEESFYVKSSERDVTFVSFNLKGKGHDRKGDRGVEEDPTLLHLPCNKRTILGPYTTPRFSINGYGSRRSFLWGNINVGRKEVMEREEAGRRKVGQLICMTLVAPSLLSHPPVLTILSRSHFLPLFL